MACRLWFLASAEVEQLRSGVIECTTGREVRAAHFAAAGVIRPSAKLEPTFGGRFTQIRLSLVPLFKQSRLRELFLIKTKFSSRLLARIISRHLGLPLARFFVAAVVALVTKSQDWPSETSRGERRFMLVRRAYHARKRAPPPNLRMPRAPTRARSATKDEPRPPEGGTYKRLPISLPEGL